MNSQDMSIISLVLHASWVVQLVMVLLLAVSVASWAAIFRKLFGLKRVKSLNDDFEREFWSGTSLNDLYASAVQNAKNAGPMERIFASGMREYQKLRERRVEAPLLATKQVVRLPLPIEADRRQHHERQAQGDDQPGRQPVDDELHVAGDQRQEHVEDGQPHLLGHGPGARAPGGGGVAAGGWIPCAAGAHR